MAKIYKKKTKSTIHSFLVHAWDAYSPSLLSATDKGKSAVVILNTVSVDYMLQGNHEWNYAPEIARKSIWESNFPVLASNTINIDGIPIDSTVSIAMVQVSPFLVGVMGLIISKSKVLASP